MRRLIQILTTLFLFNTVAFAQAIRADISNATQDENCENGSILLNINSGYAPFEYEWTWDDLSGSGTRPLNEEGPDIHQLRSYKYCVTVTDALCGRASTCFNVDCCNPKGNLEIKHYCGGDIDPGSIHVLPPDQGTQYFEVEIYGPNGKEYATNYYNFLDLISGEYRIIYSLDGCEHFEDVVIEDWSITYKVKDIKNPSCVPIAPDGYIELTVHSDWSYPNC